MFRVRNAEVLACFAGRAGSEPVSFEFVIRCYYRDRAETGLERKEIVGSKSFRLFCSWFLLQLNRGHIYYGVLHFSDGEVWLWQPPFGRRCGWQRALSAFSKRGLPKRGQLSLF